MNRHTERALALAGTAFLTVATLAALTIPTPTGADVERQCFEEGYAPGPRTVLVDDPTDADAPRLLVTADRADEMGLTPSGTCVQYATADRLP